MTELAKKLGNRLRQLRRSTDLTQEGLAEAVNVSVEFISNLERGVNAPSFKTLEKLAKALHRPVKDFFDFDQAI